MSQQIYSLRWLLLYDFKFGLNRGQSQLRANQSYVNETIGRQTDYDWFKKFQQGEFDFFDNPRCGQPSKLMI